MNAIGRTINLSLELKRLHFLTSPLSCECRGKNSWAIWQSLPAPGHNPCLATASGHRTEQAKVLLGKAKLSPPWQSHSPLATMVWPPCPLPPTGRNHEAPNAPPCAPPSATTRLLVGKPFLDYFPVLLSRQPPSIILLS